MGEEIEVTDVNGNVVRVPWHPLLEKIATHIRGRERVVSLVLRLAGLLHVADRCGIEPAEPIEAPTITRAIAIGDYAIEHARAAFGMMGADPAVEDARRLLAWAQEQEQPKFTKRDAQRALHANAAEADASIAVLQERAYVRAMPPPPAKRGRTPSPSFEINPHAKR